MNEKEGQAKAKAAEQPAADTSPTEKLRQGPTTGSLVPGAQNPESREIKREINPNTE